MAISSGTVLVSTQELLSKAELAYQRIADCDTALDRIAKTIGASDSYWQGDAGDAARVACDAVVKNARTALEELKGYPKDLLKYQKIYSAVITRTESVVNGIEEYVLA